MQVIWTPALLRPPMKLAWLGGVGRGSWPELPPPRRRPGAELGAERGSRQLPPLLSSLGTPVSLWSPAGAGLAWLRSTLPENSMPLV